jgi:hypothetical protein
MSNGPTATADALFSSEAARAWKDRTVPLPADVVPEHEAPNLHLFVEPPSVEALELPFREPGADGPAGFYRLLKTHILGRFLGLRKFVSRGG